jgi:nitroreductase
LLITINKLIKERRSYRALGKIRVTKELVEDLAANAQLAPSCANKQPWHFVFVYEPEILEKLFLTLSAGNYWAKEASMVVAVFSKKDLDCISDQTREYYLFDTGMAAALMMIRATELGLVMHPIAGYSQSKAKEILKIPEEMTIITLLIVGKKTDDFSKITEKHQKIEATRPPRKPFKEFIWHNTYTKS